MFDDGLKLHKFHDTPIAHASVIGERSSGTNFCNSLVFDNLPMRDANLTGWKHAFGTNHISAGQPHLFIVCIRNALSWVRSMYAKPWHCRPHVYENGFSAFLRSEWDTHIDKPKMYFGLTPFRNHHDNVLVSDRHPITGEKFENILKLRSAKLHSYLAIERLQSNVAYVQLETLQKDPTGTLTRLCEFYGMDVPSEIAITERELGRFPATDDVAVRRDEAKTLSDEDRAFVLDQLDLDVEAAAGYTY